MENREKKTGKESLVGNQEDLEHYGKDSICSYEDNELWSCFQCGMILSDNNRCEQLLYN